MGRTARLVVGIPIYAVVTLVIAIVALTAFVVSLNVPLVTDLVVFGSLPIGRRVTILVNLYPFVGTGFDVPTGTILIATAIAIGVNVAMLVYHFREHRVSLAEGSGSVSAAFLGTIGAGCAACGSAILIGVLGLFGAAGMVTLLPLDGLEFALLALAVVLLSTYWLARGMRGGTIRGCPVDPR